MVHLGNNIKLYLNISRATWINNNKHIIFLILCSALLIFFVLFVARMELIVFVCTSIPLSYMYLPFGRRVTLLLFICYIIIGTRDNIIFIINARVPETILLLLSSFITM